MRVLLDSVRLLRCAVVLDKRLDVELLDHLVNDRVAEVDVRQLDGRLLRDEIHLSLSFLNENVLDA